MTPGPRSRLPLLATRTAWLMLGAAIGLAVALVAVTVGRAVTQWTGVPVALPTAVVVLVFGGLAWLPGIGDLEVTAARALLGVRVPLSGSPGTTDGDPAARPPAVTGRRRVRWAGWVLLHLASGLAAGFVLLGLLPGAVVVAVASLAGRLDPIVAVGLPEPTTPALRVVTTVVALLAGAACLAVVVALGAAMARLAPLLLGPTTADRLAQAEARAATDAEHLRLARELHDGIGHALTLVGIQAAAARRSPDPIPAPVGAALTVIEDTSRQALDELDGLLAVLRRPDAEPAGRTTPATPGLDRLDALIEAHRQAGMVLGVDVPDPAGSLALPTTVSRAAYRIVAEGLTNAARHGAPGEVRLTVARDTHRLRVGVDNPAGRGRGRTGGHGLEGVAERVRLLGGDLVVGPVDGRRRWRLTADLPLAAEQSQTAEQPQPGEQRQTGGRP